MEEDPTLSRKEDVRDNERMNLQLSHTNVPWHLDLSELLLHSPLVVALDIYNYLISVY